MPAITDVEFFQFSAQHRNWLMLKLNTDRPGPLPRTRLARLWSRFRRILEDRRAGPDPGKPAHTPAVAQSEVAPRRGATSL